MSAPATSPDPSQKPTSTTPTQKRGRIYTPWPNMWIGVALSVICILLQFAAGGIGVEMLVSVVGSCYWIFCIHRIHTVLKEYTLSRYPISPRKAAGFQLIPIFVYYWSFKWTRHIAKFMHEESGGAQSMSKVWPGLLLVTASILGLWPALKSIRLCLIFGFGVYLLRKLETVVPAREPSRLRRAHQWKLSMAAGVGAVFSFVLFQAIQDFRAKDAVERLHDLAAIILVSIGVVVFLEPVFDRLRMVFGVEVHHQHALQTPKPLLLRLAAAMILVLTSVFHGLLHSEIDQATQSDLWRTVTVLLAALLVSGGITYFWIGAAHRHPPHAARSGLLSGTVLGFLVAVALLASAPHSQPEGPGITKQKIVTALIPLVPKQYVDEIAQGNASGLTQMVVITVPWAILGLAGGLAIDRRWGNGRVSSVAGSICAAGLLCGIALWLSKPVTDLKMSPVEMLSHFSSLVGWGLALMVCSSAKTLMPEEAAGHADLQAP